MLSINNALARFYASASVFVTVAIAAADPYSRHAEAMHSDGASGWVAMTLLGGLAVCGMLDVLINDWFPDSFRWPFPHKHRHMIYMFIAIGMIALTLSVAQANDLGPFIIRYLLDATVSVYIAVRGVQYHYKQRISSAHEPA